MSESQSSMSALPEPTALETLVLARIIREEHPIVSLERKVSAAYWPICTYLLELPWGERQDAFDRFKLGTLGADDLRRWLQMPEPARPEPESSPQVPVVGRFPASARDFSLSAKGVGWLWDGWLSRGRIAGLAGFEGTGKSRFALDVARRVYHGLPAPDGQVFGVAAGLPSLWICADGHQDELIGTAREMGIPSEALLFNADPDEPYGGVDLDDPDSLERLEEYLKASKAPLVFVDSLTNATRRDLCRQSDVSSLLTPLMDIAHRQDVAIILLLHLSREGQALGRRVKGLTRTLLHLECPNPDSQPDRLRLWVEKSFTVKPTPLGVTMTAEGNDYDTNPPGKADRTRGMIRPSGKLEQAIEFVLAELADGDRKGCDLVNEWVTRGENKGTLLNAKDVMVKDGRLVVDVSFKPQIWQLVQLD
jgi:hypothetical protein